jgi:enterochelin esterase-like enzyme
MKQSSWVTPSVRGTRIQYHLFESKAAKTRVSYHLYSPAAYDKDPTRRFPVLYWLHGSGGGLPGIAPLSDFFGAAIEQGKIPPMLIVFANGMASGMWCDSKDGKTPMETVVIKELLPEIDQHFRTIATREGRMIEGFSMGGYGAARLGFKYPELFAAISVLAGGPMDLEFKGPRATGNPAERERILQSVYGGDMEYFKAQSPWRLAEANASKLKERLKIRIAIGEEDFTLPANRVLSAQLKKGGISHQFTTVPKVGHDTLALLKGLGDANTEFYRGVFQQPERKQ